ncbi:hypothetical protein FJ567_21455 [Mesorhizobium sp. B2-4-16]|nr:hypothetical protein FJ567_21455 [Mesorhizobium sp. B2-4-16]TPL62311.1 hypothetical protein FJ956_25565 [Mesorhizobium sp. B2-4-3]
MPAGRWGRCRQGGRRVPKLGGARRMRERRGQLWRWPRWRLISPLVGEMSGRTEGGAKERRPLALARQGASN